MLVLFALIACQPTESPDSAAPTWSGEVGPLVVDRCAGCHQEGGIGVFPLTTAEEARVVAAAMADAVADRRMPPWQAGPDCNDYVGDFSLSEDEIAMIQAWADAGAPAGEPGEALVPPEPERLEDPDLVLEMPLVYTSPEGAGDDYRCFVVPWPYEEEVYVTAYDVEPGNTAVVHHLVAYIIEPEYAASYDAMEQGYSCFGGPGGSAGSGARWLGAWAPGGTVNELPEGVGIRMSPGSRVVMQMHYNTTAAGAQPDQTGMLLRVSDSVEQVAELAPRANPSWLGTRQMNIPAGESGVSHDYDFRLRQGSVVYSSSLHMHRLGTAASLRVNRADGSETCMLDIPTWDFNWQRSYRFEEPITLEQGDTINLSCTWDNPTDQDVFWGDGTDDEMCLATVLVVE